MKMVKREKKKIALRTGEGKKIRRWKKGKKDRK